MAPEASTGEHYNHGAPESQQTTIGHTERCLASIPLWKNASFLLISFVIPISGITFSLNIAAIGVYGHEFNSDSTKSEPFLAHFRIQ